MTSPVRPIFQEQERLTARRLNAAVEYLRSALRRVLLAPLSPGVAIGLEIAPAPDGSTITVQPGIAVDGRGRLLVLTDALTFGIADVQKQLSLLGDGDAFSICLALDDRYASFDPCAAQQPLEVVERVKLVFHEASSATLATTVLPIAGLLGLLHALAPSLSQPWDDLDPAGRRSDDFCVRLGQATWMNEHDGFDDVSMATRAGVVPRFAGLRNSFNDMSMVLGRDAGGKATIGVAVPTTFGVGAAVIHQAPVDFQTDLVVKGAAEFQNVVTFQQAAGGPKAQAAVIAASVGAPPAGRVNPTDSRVFEAAGGRDGAPAGVSGVLATSMEYDGQAAQANLNFPDVKHSGFPLALSPDPNLTVGAKLVPYHPTTFPTLVGVSAGVSSAASGVLVVPVATGGIVMAWVVNTGSVPLPTGSELTPSSTSIITTAPDQYPLQLAAAGQMVAARVAAPVPSSTQPTQVPVWVVPPYLKAS